MGIVAGFLVQNALKYLLKFGDVTNYLGYSALTDYFPSMTLKPNPQCDDGMCRQRQKEFAEKPQAPKVEKQKVENKPVHENNEWGISLVDESVDEAEDTVIHQGIKLAYTIPSKDIADASQEVKEDEASLEDLMAQMKSI